MCGPAAFMGCGWRVQPSRGADVSRLLDASVVPGTCARASPRARPRARSRQIPRSAMSGIDAALLCGYKSRATTWHTIEEKAKTNLTLQLMIMNTISEYEKLQTSAKKQRRGRQRHFRGGCIWEARCR